MHKAINMSLLQSKMVSMSTNIVILCFAHGLHTVFKLGLAVKHCKIGRSEYLLCASHARNRDSIPPASTFLKHESFPIVKEF